LGLTIPAGGDGFQISLYGEKLSAVSSDSETGAAADVFIYDKIPEGLRTQVVQIWGDTIRLPYVTPPDSDYVDDIYDLYQKLAQVLRREYSVFQLADGNIDRNDPRDAIKDLTKWFLIEKNADRVLDGIELSFRVIERVCGKSGYLHRRDATKIATEAVEELNIRFREHGIGYQYSDGKIIRVDSHLIHIEAVVPALAVLRAPEFANAPEEFLSAYEHFRHGKKQEALVDCYKCFESTMKVICERRKWSYDKTKAASELVRVCLENGLIPTYWQGHFGGLRSILESAISTPRNKQAGHGAGAGPAPELPDELVAYVLHMTAATVLFLSEANKRLV
jgi:hypothetical protein